MMDQDKLNIRRAAVLGAGVMGAQIAAHLTNAGVPTILFDLPAQNGDANAIVKDSLQSLKKLRPDPLGMEGMERAIEAANYAHDLEKLKTCDLIIEAIAEKLDWKQSLYQKILPYLKDNVILATNTSGLSIHKLASLFPDKFKSRFCGMHFFNPPRYMKLVELIAHEKTSTSLLQELEVFLVTRLGKGVIYAKDTPNFIGNRVGVFAFLSAVHHSQELELAPDAVDNLTGLLIGRPKSATFRTMDVVGLDTMNYVVNTLQQNLKNDPWASCFYLPEWINQLIERGALGQKKQEGVYKKIDNQIHVYDYHDNHYRPINSNVDKDLLAILHERDPKTRFERLRAFQHPQAKFLWRIYRDLFHYCAYHLNAIALNARDVDFAMRWGYGWKEGPFEIWQKAGWQFISQAIEEDRSQEKTLAHCPLPSWVRQEGFAGPYQKGKSELSNPVYARQYFPDQVYTAEVNEGDTIFETPFVRMWKHNDDIPILSFKTKRNTINIDVLDGIYEAIQRAEKDYKALILWQRHNDDFSFGADLAHVNETLTTQRYNLIEKAVNAFHRTAMALRYASIPTVAAIRGLTLGGACELSMHASRIIAHFETYIGLVEVGVGILPGGSGCKELALRSANDAINGNLFDFIKKYFEQIAQAKVSTSALDAKKLGYLQKEDRIVMNANELLYVAKQQAEFLAATGFHPPLPPRFAVTGRAGIANLQTLLVNWREGGFISDHDYLIGTKLAHVLCGGDVDLGTAVDENWILRLEREAIMELVALPATQNRIKYMLEKGKPLRN